MPILSNKNRLGRHKNRQNSYVGVKQRKEMEGGMKWACVTTKATNMLLIASPIPA